MDTYLTELFTGVLEKLRDEVAKFKNEEDIWRTLNGVTNPAGTLVLHLVGNLKFTIGTQLGNTGYVRNREAEFSLKDVSRAELLTYIDETLAVVKAALPNVGQAKLEEKYPLENLGSHNTAWYLSYFYGHVQYHLGQINYLRRILEAE